MPVPSRTSDAAEPAEEAEEMPDVVACESRPGRTVFTERDNSDAWIATDLTVELER